MPGKAKGKKGKKQKKLPMIGNELVGVIVKRLQKTYDRNCLATGTLPCPSLRKKLFDCAQEDILVDQIVLEPVPATELDQQQVCLIPLVNAIRQERYIYVKRFEVWKVLLSYESCSALALLLEKEFYQIANLELMDCLVDSHAALRLAQSFNFCLTLTKIVLDYNEFGDEGCLGVCEGMQGNRTIISLSMCFCGLTKISGTPLGQIISTTAVRELYLDGNDLECEGTMEIIKLCAEYAEQEAFEREEEAKRKAEELAAELEKTRPRSALSARSAKSGSETEGKGKPGSGKDKKEKKKKKKKKKKEPPPPPRVGPWLHKLHLADNGIDAFVSTSNLAPLMCMRLFRRLITYSNVFEELDLEDNLIGDSGGRELMEGLYCRKEANLGGVKVRTTHRMSSDTFNTLLKLGSGLNKKKKKGKKKKKK